MSKKGVGSKCALCLHRVINAIFVRDGNYSVADYNLTLMGVVVVIVVVVVVVVVVYLFRDGIT